MEVHDNIILTIGDIDCITREQTPDCNEKMARRVRSNQVRFHSSSDGEKERGGRGGDKVDRIGSTVRRAGDGRVQVMERIK